MTAKVARGNCLLSIAPPNDKPWRTVGSFHGFLLPGEEVEPEGGLGARGRSLDPSAPRESARDTIPSPVSLFVLRSGGHLENDSKFESWARSWSWKESRVLGRSLAPLAVASQRARERAGCHPLASCFVCFVQRRTASSLKQESQARKWSWREDRVLGRSLDARAVSKETRAKARSSPPPC